MNEGACLSNVDGRPRVDNYVIFVEVAAYVAPSRGISVNEAALVFGLWGPCRAVCFPWRVWVCPILWACFLGAGVAEGQEVLPRVLDIFQHRPSARPICGIVGGAFPAARVLVFCRTCTACSWRFA